MRKMKNRRFTLIGLFIILFYLFFILPYPQRFPNLPRPYAYPVLIVLVGVLAYIDEKLYEKE